MNKLLVASLASLAICVSGSAMAGDGSTSWTGLYAGARVDYGFGKTEVTYAGESQPDIKPDGIQGGLKLGGDYQFPNGIVLGLVGDLSLSDVEDTNHYSGTIYGFPASVAAKYKLDYTGTLRARAGYAVGDALPYVTGGLAWARGEGETTIEVALPGSPFSNSQKKTHTGWTLGAGLDYALSENLTANIEYLYTDLGSETYTGGGFSVDLHPKISQLGVGLSYRF